MLERGEAIPIRSAAGKTAGGSPLFRAEFPDVPECASSGKIPSFSLSYSRVLNSLSPLRSSWQALNVEYYPLRLGVFSVLSLPGVLCARKKRTRWGSSAFSSFPSLLSSPKRETGERRGTSKSAVAQRWSGDCSFARASPLRSSVRSSVRSPSAPRSS